MEKQKLSEFITESKQLSAEEKVKLLLSLQEGVKDSGVSQEQPLDDNQPKGETCAPAHSAAAKPAARASKSVQRRPNQDYTKLDDFLPPSQWEALERAYSSRDKAEVLAECCFRMLALRLPTELTYGTMAGIVGLLTGCMGNQWALQCILQEVKSEWKKVRGRLSGKYPDPKELLPVLPLAFEDLPASIRETFGEERPALPRQRSLDVDAIRLAAAKIPLRGGSLVSAPTIFQRLAEGTGQHMVDRPGRLTNLQIFPQRVRRDGAFSRNSGDGRQTLMASPEAEKRSTGNTTTPRKATPLAIENGPSAPTAPEQGMRPQGVSPVKPPEPSKMPSHQCPEQRLLEALRDEDAEPSRQKDAQAQALTSAMITELGGQGTGHVMKRPAALKRPAAVLRRPASSKKPKTSGTIVAESAGESGQGNKSFSAKRWGSCRAEFYTQKSYIRFSSEGKWKMVIGSTAPNHRQICKKLIPFVSKGCSREELLSQRELLQC